ncbi:nucleotidyltransferase domain-containing protein [Sphingomonas sp.]|uniref:nucleotidyltransferase domain-containing protein n=1 Tax=Sphingomonas sp. TaxID=28214 RepID=UPI0025D562F5|nr:nucleotidyltransferase domain-containing protein [Sphingomonas sp.]
MTRFRTAVTEIYGERVERVVLFGSRARGDAKPDSDYDIAVFIRDAGTFTDESARIALWRADRVRPAHEAERRIGRDQSAFLDVDTSQIADADAEAELAARAGKREPEPAQP